MNKRGSKKSPFHHQIFGAIVTESSECNSKIYGKGNAVRHSLERSKLM